jgi:hypothetical protein
MEAFLIPIEWQLFPWILCRHSTNENILRSTEKYALGGFLKLLGISQSVSAILKALSRMLDKKYQTNTRHIF